MSKQTGISRRKFLGATGAGAAAFAFNIVPRHCVAGSNLPPPSEKLNIAKIGVAGMGKIDLKGVAEGNNIVALCDVDEERAVDAYKEHPQARRFTDFRRMLDEMEKDIDAVVVSTPDHTHAVACMAAIKRGKHVYCQKPLAHSVWEVRELMKAAREYKVVTQLGNQGHSTESIRLFCEWIWDGAIGKVHSIDLGCGHVYSALRALQKMQTPEAVLPGLDWDLWQGPVPERSFRREYVRGAWRSWAPYGNGIIGDWACHVVDPVFWALELGAPQSVRAEVIDYDPKLHGATFPPGDIITYKFAATEKRGAITMNWHSGKARIPRPPELEPERATAINRYQGNDVGAYVYGENGVIAYGSHGASGCRLIPETKMQEYRRPEKTLPRVKGSHYQDWLDAIREQRKAGSDFADYGGPLTEVAMLGVIALHFPGVQLEWDSRKMAFTNCGEANAWLKPAYRKGWSL